MASNGLQPGQEDAGAYPEEDALASGADLEEVTRYAKWRGNLLKGTTDQRLAWSAAYPAAEGVFFSDLDLDILFRSDGSGGWEEVLWWNDWATQSLGSGWDTSSSPSSGVRYRRRGSLLEIHPSDYVRTSNLTVNAAANVTVATLPTGFRPSSTRALGGGSIGVAGNLGASRWFLSSAGALYFQSMVTSGTMAAGGGAVNHVDHGYILVDLT